MGPPMVKLSKMPKFTGPKVPMVSPSVVINPEDEIHMYLNKAMELLEKMHTVNPESCRCIASQTIDILRSQFIEHRERTPVVSSIFPHGQAGNNPFDFGPHPLPSLILTSHQLPPPTTLSTFYKPPPTSPPESKSTAKHIGKL